MSDSLSRDRVRVTICHIGYGLTEGPMPWSEARELCDKLDEIKSPYQISIVNEAPREGDEARP